MQGNRRPVARGGPGRSAAVWMKSRSSSTPQRTWPGHVRCDNILQFPLFLAMPRSREWRFEDAPMGLSERPAGRVQRRGS